MCVAGASQAATTSDDGSTYPKLSDDGDFASQRPDPGIKHPSERRAEYRRPQCPCGPVSGSTSLADLSPTLRRGTSRLTRPSVAPTATRCRLAVPVKGSDLSLSSQAAHPLSLSSCRRSCATLSCSADRIRSERLSFIGAKAALNCFKMLCISS